MMEKTMPYDSQENLDIYHFEANLTDEHGLIIQLNDNALTHLIEMLEYLQGEPKISGKHFHVDECSGLVGNIPSIIFMRSLKGETP